MRTYAYIRYSTNKQDEYEQEVIIRRYCEVHNIKIDETVIDRATSGAVSWADRNLAELISKIEPGDTLLCSEASRISRSMSDFSTLLNEGLRRLQVRLIICNIGLDIDCSNVNAMTEMQLQMVIFFAQFERELLIQRTKAALDHRRDLLEEQGGWVSKTGNWCTGFGPHNQYTAHRAGAISAKRKKKKSLQVDPKVMETILEMRRNHMSYDQIANTLNNMELKTASGRMFYGTTIKRMITAYEEIRQEEVFK